MSRRIRTAVVVAAAMLTVGGIAGGVAYAVGAGSGPAVTTAALSAAPATTSPAAAPKGRRPLLSRVEHGEATVRTKTGAEVVDLQRGTVTAATPTSVTVRSQDGYTATYTVTSTSRIRRDGRASSISAVAVADRVVLVAAKQGSADNVLRLADAGAK
jgi:hypothetical protein